MFDFSSDLSFAYSEAGTPATSNGAGVFGFYGCVSMDVLADNGQGLISVTKKTFRIITGAIPNLLVNTTILTFNNANYLIISSDLIGDGLETVLTIQAK